MIAELRIRALGVIDEAVVPFSAGFTVLTGETGAGKTMVLTGLDLITGGKADSGLVRQGAERADADGEWQLTPAQASALADRLAEAGAALEEAGDGTGDGAVLLVGRTVAAGGRSRAFAGGRTVPASTLTDLCEGLITVHGQSDQLLLRDPRRQRELLDLFAGPGLLDLRTAHAADLGDWRAARSELADLVTHRQERAREAVLLRHGIDEIAAIAPEPGEDEELKARAAVLAHATDLVADLGQVHDALGGGEEAASVADLLGRLRKPLERVGALSPGLAHLTTQLDGLADAASALASEVGVALREVDADPARLAALEDRRHALSGLKRRYGPDLSDVLQWWAQAQRTVDEVDGADERIAALQAGVDEIQQRLVARAAQLSRVRGTAAGRLGAAVTAELADLSMPDAQVSVVVTSDDDPEAYTPSGADSVAIHLSSHAGAQARPVDRSASGGELSRIMLAIEVVLAGVNPVPTFVFDEVDAGIGGKVAVEVGRRLGRLARSAQVIVVTHLPQVAAFADRHVVVTKDSAGSVTATSVRVVDGPERVRELVRMLSGLEDSESGAEHAAELLALAQADRG